MAETLDDLRRVVRTCPIIDNHAHNLLRPHQLRTSDFLTITTEASGEALLDTPKSLAHLRAAKQLRKLYDLPADADWKTIVKKRDELLLADADALTKKCFEGIHAVLIDDGLGNPADFENYHWHSKFTTSPAKRIVRIEAVAASILSTLHQQGKLPEGIAVADEEACSLAWLTFVTAFEQAIISAIEADEVVGFKSVICYRTGLDVEVGRDVEVSERGLKSFRRHFLPTAEAKQFRVQSKGLCDALVISACKLIAAAASQTGKAKPIQFHTGLGDNDISIIDSNPGLLQPLIKAYPAVPIVLLHSAYPYTREAGYLATVYRNCFLDIGEVFPMVARHGQETIIRQALELAPTSKLLWSTDGHLQAETYWLANVQGREGLEKILVEFVEYGDLTVADAITALRDILFENSNKLYHLDLQLPQEHEDAEPAKNRRTDIVASSVKSSRLDPALLLPGKVDYYIVQWIDWLGALRCRWIPGREFNRLTEANQLRFGISRGNLGTLQNDGITTKCVPVGQIYVKPDLHSYKALPRTQGSVLAGTLMASFEEADGTPVDLCPRSRLTEVLQSLAAQHGLTSLLGFEIEVTFCRRPKAGSDVVFTPFDANHAWSTLTDEQMATSMPLMAQVVAALADAGIHVQQFHSEAGPGQYEFVLPPLPPVEAIDTLYQSRQIIQQVAASHGLRATCHPSPFPPVGTACHANISLSSSGKPAANEKQMSFFAGVLPHLPALCAFTLPEEASYVRVADDHWTSGTWVAWGTQNREVPLRRVAGLDGTTERWEVRCLDGMPNMYLAMFTVFAAGLQGLKDGREMKFKDCQSNTSQLSVPERANLGIEAKLPTSLSQSLEALEADAALTEALGAEIVDHYIGMKSAEQAMLNKMDPEARRVWLMERY